MKSCKTWTGEIALQVKAYKPVNLSSGTHLVKDREDSWKLSSDLHVCTYTMGTHMHTHVHTYTQTNTYTWSHTWEGRD